MTIQRNRNFLSQLIQHEERQWPRRPTKLKCTIYYLRKGIHGYSAQKGLVLNISEGGCMVECPSPDAAGEHVHLVIDGVEVKFSCAVRNKSETALHMKFYEEVSTEFLDKMLARRF
jgi:hypothetical protein